MESLSLRALRSFSGVGQVDLWSASTALLLVDMQVSCVRQQGHTIRRLRERGLEEAVRQYEDQMRVAIPNLARLLARARESGQLVVHTRVTRSGGRQAGGWYREGSGPQGSSDEAEIIEELAPRSDESVITKSVSGVFASTNLDFLLRKRGVTALIVGGVVTNGCVEHAITHGHDLGYACVLVSDGSAALTDEIHHNALERLEHRRAHVLSTDALLDMAVVPPTQSV